MSTMTTGDRERDALIEQVGQFCPCGIDLLRNGCYRCLKARGAVWTCDPATEAAWHGRPNPYARTVGPCPCACNSGGFCGGCGHAGCGRR